MAEVRCVIMGVSWFGLERSSVGGWICALGAARALGCWAVLTSVLYCIGAVLHFWGCNVSICAFRFALYSFSS